MNELPLGAFEMATFDVFLHMANQDVGAGLQMRELNLRAQETCSGPIVSKCERKNFTSKHCPFLHGWLLSTGCEVWL